MDEMRNGHNGEDDENERVSATGTTAKTDREQRKRASGAQLRDERENVKCELGGNLLFWVPKTSFIYYWDSGKGGAAYDECYLRERMRDYKSYGHPCYAPIGSVCMDLKGESRIGVRAFPGVPAETLGARRMACVAPGSESALCVWTWCGPGEAYALMLGAALEVAGSWEAVTLARAYVLITAPVGKPVRVALPVQITNCARQIDMSRFYFFIPQLSFFSSPNAEDVHILLAPLQHVSNHNTSTSLLSFFSSPNAEDHVPGVSRSSRIMECTPPIPFAQMATPEQSSITTAVNSNPNIPGIPGTSQQHRYSNYPTPPAAWPLFVFLNDPVDL
ncbi:hypothetical protein BD779DRAFT_1481097 [Infundibulicybe gibba]|nr:hypothetical protein BD779DRAFT_1481097 [Infundibulicybe gibba]